MSLPISPRAAALVRVARRAKPDFISDAEWECPTPPESTDHFLQRGGTITQCLTHPASGLPSSQTIHMDGNIIPQSHGAHEYVPSFVRDLTSYDAAQRNAPTDFDDGTASIWTEYEQESIPGDWKPSMRGEFE